MCCSEGCSFSGTITVNLSAQRIFAPDLPRVTNAFGNTILIEQPDQPRVILSTGSSVPVDERLDEAEVAVITDIFDREQESPELSAALERIIANRRIVNGELSPSVVIVQDGSVNGGEADFEPTTNNDAAPTAGVPVVIRFSREWVVRRAELFRTSVSELLAELIIHELLHPGLGRFTSNHGGSELGSRSFYRTAIGQAGIRAYMQLFDGRLPPGLVFSESFNGVETELPPIETPVNEPAPPQPAPPPLDDINSSPQNAVFFENAEGLLEATNSYPFFDIGYGAAQ